jgi:putative flippase GtrA
MKQLKELLKRPGMRYLIVGGSVYVLELIVIVVAQHYGATAVQAVALSFLIGLVVSFLLQKLFTFGDTRMHHKIVIPQVIAVVLLVLFNLGFTVLVTKLLQDIWPPVVTRTLALGVTTIWNFYLYKTRIFNQSRGEQTLLID